MLTFYFTWPQHTVSSISVNNETHTDEICYPNSVAVCSKTPELVTITMKKQPCGRNLKMTTSKMCITYPDGQWSCQNLTSEACRETNISKIISTEATQKGHPKTTLTKSWGLNF